MAGGQPRRNSFVWPLTRLAFFALKNMAIPMSMGMFGMFGMFGMLGMFGMFGMLGMLGMFGMCVSSIRVGAPGCVLLAGLSCWLLAGVSP